MLQGHPIVGSSWEGFVLEQIAAALPSMRDPATPAEARAIGFVR